SVPACCGEPGARLGTRSVSDAWRRARATATRIAIAALLSCPVLACGAEPEPRRSPAPTSGSERRVAAPLVSPPDRPSAPALSSTGGRDSADDPTDHRGTLLRWSAEGGASELPSDA